MSWQEKAACEGTDTELFYPEVEGYNSINLLKVRAAKEICAQCPVQVDCLTYALARREQYGVWGGLTAQERKALLLEAVKSA